MKNATFVWYNEHRTWDEKNYAAAFLWTATKTPAFALPPMSYVATEVFTTNNRCEAPRSKPKKGPTFRGK